MRILADENFPRPIVDFLVAQVLDAEREWTGHVSVIRRDGIEMIMARAR
jgi:hypothetical protein